MKKILYISVNSKPENVSVSKTAGREFVNRLISKTDDYILDELDLYNIYMPEPNHRLYKRRAELVTGADYQALSEQDKRDVDRLDELCNQFLSADNYVIAAPMWSISFPSILKKYVDCIILNNKVIKISPDEVKGLLDDKERNMVYIQSSGGIYPKILGGKLNHGVDYFHDIFKFLGIKRFEKILIEGVDMPSVGRDEALKKAYKEMDGIVEKFTKEHLLKI